MNETLYSWTFTFHKVVRQQNSGAVEDFILSYSAVYLRIQRGKNYWNRSTFAKVIVKIKVAPFLWPTVYIYHTHAVQALGAIGVGVWRVCLPLDLFICFTPCRHTVLLFTARCIALRLHVVCLSVCKVGGSESHKLEILETNCTYN